MKSVSVPVSSRWPLLLLLSACLTLAASADCGSECARCSARLPLQQIEINSIECVLQCEEHLNAGNSWSLCKHFMLNNDNTPEADQESTETKHWDTQPQQVDKKYGGFMKRYGGFMKRYGGFMKRYGGFMKKTAELYGVEPEDVDQSREVLTNHDVEMLTNQVENDGEREEAAVRDLLNSKGGAEDIKGIMKRYGGFMRREALYDSESEVRSPQKRYGGFMRRVGRPEWWQESKRYGGFLKRFPQEDEDDNLSEIEKRYGGFMGY